MISSSGFSKKILSLFRSLLSLSIITAILISTQLPILASSETDASAADSIKITSVISYTIDKSGKLNANMKLNLTNEDPQPTLIKLYTIRMPFTDITNFSARQFGAALQFTADRKSDRTDIAIDLNDEPLYGGDSLDLALTFDVPHYLQSEVDLSQIDLPVSIDGIRSERVVVQFESSWGDLKYVLGAGSTINRNSAYTTVIMDSPTSYTATLVFNEITSYSFKIEKRLENSGNVEIVSEVSLPRSQYNQRVTFENISPLPDLAYQDDSANIMLAYKIAPGHYIDLSINGDLAYVNGNEVTQLYPDINKYLHASGFWEINDEAGLNNLNLFLRSNGINLSLERGESVSNLTLEEREKFYALIYHFTQNQLNYSTGNIEGLPSSVRSGANSSIKGNNNASTEDYSDLMIAIYRKYGVPSRMAIGYVTNITEQFEDPFIHNWVEYWDPETGWHSSDPSLAEISKSYMHDTSPLDHISFLARSTNPSSPNLQYYERDTLVFNSDEVAATPQIMLETESTFSPTDQLKINSSGSVKVTNLGNTIIEALTVSESLSNVSSEMKEREIIVPGQSVELPFAIKLKQSQMDNLKDGEIKLTFVVAAKSVENGSYANVHTTDLQVSTFWWWNVLLQSFSSIIFILLFILGYNIYKRLFGGESFLNNLVNRIR